MLTGRPSSTRATCAALTRSALSGCLPNTRSISESEARIRLVRHAQLRRPQFSEQRPAHHPGQPQVRAGSDLSRSVAEREAPGDNIITCIQLIPYSDAETGSLYVQANTIIPVPGIENYVIGVGGSSTGDISVARGTSTLSETFARNSSDDVSQFLGKVADLTLRRLPDQLEPDKKSRWAGVGDGYRYYHLWYSRPPWANWGMTYLVNLYPGSDESPTTREAHVGFAYWGRDIADLESRLEGLHVYDDQRVENREILVTRRGALDDSFANTLAATLRHFIEVVTPVVNDFENERNEENA